MVPNRLGGMGIIDPIQFSRKASVAITRPLVECLLEGAADLPYDVMVKQLELVKDLSSERKEELRQRAEQVKNSLVARD